MRAGLAVAVALGTLASVNAIEPLRRKRLVSGILPNLVVDNLGVLRPGSDGAAPSGLRFASQQVSLQEDKTGEAAPADDVKLKHKITWVDTTPPAWMLAESHMCRGVNVVNGDESVRPVFKFTYGGGASPPEGESGTVNVLELRGPGQVLYYADQMVAVQREECEFSASQEAYSSTTSYMRSTAMNMGLSAEVAAFGGLSASAEASSVEHGMKSGENEMFQARAQCLLATVRLSNDSALHPDFAARLQAWVGLDKQAAESNDDMAIETARQVAFKLFEDFGTHYYSQADFGGELISRKFMSKETVSKSTEKERKASFGASVKAGFGGVNITNEAGTTRKDESETSSTSGSETIIAHGGQPGSFSAEAGADLAWGSWAQTLPQFPVPLNEQLKPLSKLIRRLPGVENSFEAEASLYKIILDFLSANAVPRQTSYLVFAVYERSAQEEDGQSPLVAPASPRDDLVLEDAKGDQALPNLAEAETFPVLDIYGSNGDIKDWKLGSNVVGKQFKTGQAMLFERDLPSIGAVKNIRLVMPANTEFRMFQVFDLASQDVYIFDTRESARLPDAEVQGKDAGKWVWESASLRFTEEELAVVGEDGMKTEAAAVPRKQIEEAFAAIYSSTESLNRYEIVVESVTGRMINIPGAVSLTLFGEAGSVGVRAPLFQHKWWSVIGQQTELEASGDRGKLIVASRSPGFLNFPMSLTDDIQQRYSVISKEGRNIGQLTDVEISIAAEASMDPEPFMLPRDEQRRLAIGVCQQLTRGYGPGPSDQCTPDMVKELASDFGIKDLSSDDCERVKFFMQNEEAELKCMWDSDKGKWLQFKGDKKVTSWLRSQECSSFKQQDGGSAPSICSDLFPDDGETSFFMAPEGDPNTRFLAVKRVFVTDSRIGDVFVADFGGARIMAGQSVKKQAL